MEEGKKRGLPVPFKETSGKSHMALQFMSHSPDTQSHLQGNEAETPELFIARVPFKRLRLILYYFQSSSGTSH